MKVKRVLVVTTSYLGFNGITSVIMNYYRNINREKVQFDFAIGRGIHKSIKEEIIFLGGQIFELAPRKRHFFKYLSQLKKIIRDKEYDIVHVHGNSGTLYFDIHTAKLAGAKVRISHCHNSTCTHKIAHHILKPLLNKEITHALACSNLAGDWLYTKDYIVINNGIDIEKFKFDSKTRKKYREQLNLEEKFVIGHIGHFSYQKNHEYVLEIFKEVLEKKPNCILLLIGDGKLRKNIERKISQLGIERNVMCLGKRNDASELMKAMDTFVLPSRFEGLPVVLVEAQTSGLRCVVSDVITDEVQITGSVKFIGLDSKPNFWADIILENVDQYDRYKNIDLVRTSKFNIKNEVDRLEEIYLIQ